jgi:hypothetical protein
MQMMSTSLDFPPLHCERRSFCLHLHSYFDISGLCVYSSTSTLNWLYLGSLIKSLMKLTKHYWLMPVILAAWEAEIGRITV